MTASYRCRGSNSASFDEMYGKMAEDLLLSRLVHVGEWQAQKSADAAFSNTLEVIHARVEVPIAPQPLRWEWMTTANCPWAEDHFQERVGGQPLNPPPSNLWWPFAKRGNEEHKNGEIFSHTYPERFWPRYANEGGKTREGRHVYTPRIGVRGEYGDYDHLLYTLRNNPATRQAYLPIWFPEDLKASTENERVPCTLGYHFLVRNGELHVEYHIRSCDVVRHFRDDVYMAGRLAHDIIEKTGIDARPGMLVMNIGSLHAFQPDIPFLQKAEKEGREASSRRLMEYL